MNPSETPTSDWSIADGPSREELFDALRLFNEHRKVAFQGWIRRGSASMEGFTLGAQVNSIAVEDGSGHSWNLMVYLPALDESGPYEIYYHDGRRKGHFVNASV